MPVIVNIYGFSSASSLAIEIVAVLFPLVKGENVIANPVEPLIAMGVVAV